MAEYPNVFGREQLMAFSGMEGETSAWGGIVASSLGDRLGYWLHTNRERWNSMGVRVYLTADNLRGPEDAVFDAVLGDLCRGRIPCGGGEATFTFLPLTMRGFGIEVKIPGVASSMPSPLYLEIEVDYPEYCLDIDGERVPRQGEPSSLRAGAPEARRSGARQSQYVERRDRHVALLLAMTDRSDSAFFERAVARIQYKDEVFTVAFPGAKFERTKENVLRAEVVVSGRMVICWGDGQKPTTADELAALFGLDWEALARKRLEWTDSLVLPPDLPESYRRFYLRCCCSLKTNAYQPEGKMTVPWTTPDRWPHRHCYFWDSAFQALGYALIDPEWGKNAVRAQWCQQEPDGFISSMVHHDGAGKGETNSAVLGWLSWEMLGKEPDLRFIEEEAYPTLAAYHRCCLAHRDPEWHNLIVWPRFSHGMDNSGRFDNGNPKVYADANLYVAHDLLIMEKMAQFLGKDDEAKEWRHAWKELGEAINDHLWHEGDGFYYDMAEDGSLVRVRSMVAFVALLAEIAPAERRERLLARLLDPEEFWTKMPVATTSLRDPTYEKNMWRGPMWPNTSYVAYRALQKAGHEEEARELAELVLEEEVRWYEATGGIYEFYDAEGETAPLDIERKSGRGALNDYGWGMAVGAKLCWELFGG